MRKSIRNAVIILGLLISLAGCSPITTRNQPQLTGQIILQDGEKTGQSFIAEHGGLIAVGVHIDPTAAENGVINFRLTAPNQPTAAPIKSSLELDQITTPGFYNFYFSPVKNSTWQPFLFTLEFNGEGEIAIATAPGEAYLQGAQYVDNQPVDGQLAFQLVYSLRWLAAGLAQEFLQWSWWLLAGILLFILPGWGILSLTYQKWPVLSWWEKAALSSGASLIFYPLVTLWTHQIGWQIGPWLAGLPMGFGLVMLAVRGIKLVKNRHKLTQKVRISWPDLTILVLLAVIFFSRTWVIRGLPTGMWGDSVQHTYVTQLLVDQRGLFDSWLPYAPLYTFTYHFGFHSLAAAFHWLTGLQVTQAVPVVGGLLNVLAVLGLYPLTLRLSRSPWAGVFTILLAGLLFQMPMDYVNWGRYTQTAGMVVLPAAVIMVWDYYQDSKISWRLLGLTWLLLSGLALTHYRVLIFALLFIPAFILIRFRQLGLWNLILRTVWIGLGAVALIVPWIITVNSGKLDAITAQQLARPASQITEALKPTIGFGDVFTYLPPWAWLLLPIILAWGFWRRNLEVALLSLWWFFILLAANPQWLNLPGVGIITSFAVMIVVYFPAGILFGAGIGWIQEVLARKGYNTGWLSSVHGRPGRTDWRTVLIASIITLLALISLPATVKTVDYQEHTLTTWPDIAAFDWIRNNTSSDANFLVNSFFAYGGALLVGSDSGWWLPLLTSRSSSLPPLTYGSEQGPRPDNIDWVNALTRLIQEKGVDDPQVIQELKTRNISHIFIGQRQGMVNSPTPLISLENLMNSNAFKPVYHQDRVWIFERVN